MKTNRETDKILHRPNSIDNFASCTLRKAWSTTECEMRCDTSVSLCQIVIVKIVYPFIVHIAMNQVGRSLSWAVRWERANMSMVVHSAEWKIECFIGFELGNAGARQFYTRRVFMVSSSTTQQNRNGRPLTNCLLCVLSVCSHTHSWVYGTFRWTGTTTGGNASNMRRMKQKKILIKKESIHLTPTLPRRRHRSHCCVCDQNGKIHCRKLIA